jgi:DNA-binding XRE family transcriptional regulator
MEMKDRIRYFRKDVKKLTQDEFRKEINLSRSNLASIETGAVKLTDRVIADICKTFNISEHWLRTGEGNMYVESDASLVDSLAKQMNMSAEQRKLMEIFLSMSDEKRDSISRAFFDFLDAAQTIAEAPSAKENQHAATENRHAISLTDEEIEAELADYRAELLAERKARSASEDGSSDVREKA